MLNYTSRLHYFSVPDHRRQISKIKKRDITSCCCVQCLVIKLNETELMLEDFFFFLNSFRPFLAFLGPTMNCLFLGFCIVVLNETRVFW